MSRLPFLHRFPAEGVLLDAGLLLSLWTTAVSTWTINNYATAFAIIGVLQALTIGPAIAGLMNNPPGPPETAADRLLEAISPVAVLMAILAAGGFMWLFIPAIAIGAGPIWGLFMVNFFVVLFGSLLLFGVFSESKDNPLHKPAGRFIYSAIVFLYLAVSEGLLRGAGLLYGVELPVILFGLGMAYLPIRLLLVWRPPHSLLEMGTALLVFTLFVVSLF